MPFRVLLLVTAVALLATACTAAAASCDERLPGVRPGLCPTPEAERQPAPRDEVPLLGEDGASVSLAEFDGRVVVVNFWASWCGPCRVEQPDLNDAAEALPADEVAFLGVNIEDSRASALAHVREFDIPYPHVYDPSNEYASRYGGIGPRTIPSTVIVDAEGRVAVRILGLTTATEILVLADLVAAGDGHG